MVNEVTIITMGSIAATVTAGTDINKVTDLYTIKCDFLCRTATACLAHSDVLDGVTETH
jgi:hypothetical protein